MPRYAVLLWLAVATPWGVVPATAQPDGARVTLAESLALARANYPGLEAARQLALEARGELTSARLPLRENPEIEGGAGPRAGADEPSTTDFEIGLEQRLEIGGQRRHRIEVAGAAVAAAEATADEAARQLDLAVAETFYEALAADEEVRLLEDNEALAAGVEELARRRLELGEGTQLELNTVRVRRTEAARRLAAGRAVSGAALVRLGELLALPAGEPPQPVGALPIAAAVEGEAELLSHAMALRSDLLVDREEVERARAAVGLADAEAIPDIAIGATFGREERQDVVLAGVRIPLPFVQRNQGERETARATLRRREAELAQRRLAVAGEVGRAWQAYTAARAASELYDVQVLAAQAESLELLERAYAAGEVSFAELVVIQRELLESRLGGLKARLELARATARLLAAVYLPQTQILTGGVE